MSDIDISFKEQQKQEDAINFKAIGIQLSVNAFCCIVIFGLFCWLRPRYPSIYSPKSKLSKYDLRRPRTLNSGWFDWVIPIIRMDDNELIEHIGFDAYIFMYFIRLLRQLIITLTLISMFIFLPINIIAAYNTSDWPPAPGLDFMSISAMNYDSGKESKSPNYLWYWSPTIASWVFSTIVMVQFYLASQHLLRFRLSYYLEHYKKYKALKPSFSPTELLQYDKQDLISRTLLVHLQFTEQLPDANHHKLNLRESPELKAWIDDATQLPCQYVYIGKYNPRLYLLVSDYKSIIKKLEKVIHHFLQNSEKKRPTIRIGWKLKEIDAIDYYTEKALTLEKIIQKNRSRLEDCSYVWIVYSSLSKAHHARLKIEKGIAPSDTATCLQVQLAPQPEDIVWSSMNIDTRTIQLKQFYGYTLFVSTIFIWCIPFGLLAVTSNLINLIRLFPQSDRILAANNLLLGVVQSYLTPCLTVLLHIRVPQALTYISQQQAYRTKTVIQERTLLKLYTFFVINNLFIFTLVNIMVGIIGQITALTLLGKLQSKAIAPYIVQIAKNMTDLSSFWIDYVCFRAVGASFELIRVVPLFIGMLQGCLQHVQFLTRLYTPREIDTKMNAPFFAYARNYGLVISFFTIVLVYSVAAPIVLPFALVYFLLVSTAYKYKLVYIYVTETETHGRIWVLLGRLMIASLVIFQAMMILILSLKAGLQQTYTLIPLPFLTAILGTIYTRYLDHQSTLEAWYKLTKHMTATMSAPQQELQEIDDWSLLNTMYADQALHEPLWKPMVDIHDMERIYAQHPQWLRIRDTLTQPAILTELIPTSPSLEEINIIHYNEKEPHIETVPMQPVIPTETPSAPPIEPPTYHDAMRRHSF